ncbi:hypothetical protein BBW65_07290 [Helicobacter enhydrae]|uniref:SPOR domain-containing protein n=1 Tax=Helicobacter enhydrae TaxID=222136 RepID=A0A1B1U7A9_9HELI|nr:SPOR domain-containing protein [Helicobacter enhydrae]ANV98611.1 hypothetical protein BBW65_07290 [Helicobacter enhydrae]
MDHNLDDILMEETTNPTPKKSKKTLAILVASVSLIVILLIVIFFFTKKETALNEELAKLDQQKLENFVDQSMQSMGQKEEDDFEKMIADVKIKHEASQKKQNETLEAEIAGETAPSKPNAPIQEAPIASKEPKTEAPKPKTEVPKTEIALAPKTEVAHKKEPKKTKPPKEITKPQIKQIPKGFYYQVGVFSGTPNANFTKKIAAFMHRVQQANSNGKVVKKYLIGPYASKAKALDDAQKIADSFGKYIIIEIK